ncbi:MAG: holo-ACP synthase [Myxococcota bacterium]|nr:holo-ACP synthase [Myxococcota bacterium]
MIIGVGIDLAEVGFWRAVINDPTTTMVAGTFTPQEQDDCGQGPVPPEERYAARFAAKEATIKALAGVRLGKPPIIERIHPIDIEVQRDAWGRPCIKLHNEAEHVARQLGVEVIHLSISHESSHAVAVTILEKY